MKRGQEELRQILEEQIAEKNRRTRGRKYYVEPKIGSPTPDAAAEQPESLMLPMFSEHSPQRGNSPPRHISPARQEHYDRKTAELRAALEEQIEEKRRRQAELHERQRLESRDLLARAGPTTLPGAPSSSDAAAKRMLDRAPVVHGVAVAVEAKTTVPASWHSHEFLNLSKKDEEEKRRKQSERQRAEELRADLERQIKDKEAAQRRLLEDERRAEREYEEKQQRVREEAVQNERRRQEEMAKLQQQLQEENLVISKLKNGKPPTENPALSPPHPRLHSAASPTPAPMANSSQYVAPFGAYGAGQQPQIGAVPVVDSVGVSGSDGDLRAIVSRIHRELLQQRQDFLSPSIFSAIPYSNVARAAPSPLPVVTSMPDELPADRRLLVSSHLAAARGPPASPSKHLHATGGGIFSMTSWLGTGGFQQADVAASLESTTANPISDVLRKNQNRLKKLRFAKHNDDILRIFLEQDNPANVAAVGTLVDAPLPPPSWLHNR